MPRKRREVPWLEPDDNGYYYTHWYDEKARRTKRESMGAQDPIEAQKRFAAWLLDGRNWRDPAAGVAGLKTREVLEFYRREHVETKVIDKDRADDAIAHLNEFFGDTLIADVDIPLSRAYARARRAGEIGGGKRRPDKAGSDGTIRRELVVLTAAANHCAEWKRIGPKATPPTPMPSVELPAETREEAPYLTVEELASVIDKAPTLRLRRFIRILYYTAARRASVEGLTRFQIDLKTSRITLRAPDETDLQRRSKKRRPVVPLHPEIRPDVEQLLAETNSEFLFGDDRSMYRAYTEHLGAIGLGEKAKPHLLRHSRATHLLQSGVSLYDVAKLLGDTVATVERVYGHHCPDFLGATIAEKTA